MRDLALFLALSVAAACVVVGVAHWSHGAAWIVAGVCVAALVYLVVGGDTAPDGATPAVNALEVEA